MSAKTFIRKKYTLLVRKLTIEHDMQFASLSRNAGVSTNIKTSSECLLNQQIPFIVYEDGHNDTYVQLHVLTKIINQDIQLGMISFDVKNQKILKPLTKQFFSKQFANKRGYIQYKFIASESKTVTESEMANHIEKKNQILLNIEQHGVEKEEVQSLMALINEKDEVINKMNDQIQKLIKQTKKLNKSLSKQKTNSQQIQRNISLNVKLNQNLQTTNKHNKSTNNLWQKQKDQYEYQIQKLSRRIRDLQNREGRYKEQIQSLRKKLQSEGKDNQKKISDLRKQIEYRYDKETVKQNRLVTQSKSSENDLQTQKEKKNKYIEQQLEEQIRRIEAQKQKQLKKDFELQLKLELEKQNQREKQRQRQREREKQRDKQIQKFKQKQREREKSKNYLRQSHAEQHKELLKQMHQLDNDRVRLKEKLEIKDDQLNNFVIKLERAQKQISKLEDQNIQLRKTKSTLLREVEGMTFKNQPQQMKSSLDNKPIFEYEKMILNERKQINDEKLKAEIDELRSKIKRDEKQFKQKLQEKEMQVMKLRLSEKSASRQKQIYSNRIKQIMQNVEGDRKSFLQALQNAHKFETQQSRTKQLQLQKNQLEKNNHKLVKQKQDLQNAVKKLKSKIDERQGEWVLLKSIEAQHDYYKTQCEKFEKANKKFEKQYESIKQYCQNLEHIVGKKPRKTMDEDLNTEREQRYKNEIRSRLEMLMQQVSDMENKFYVEQVQIWLTERTNIIQYYAKKFEADKIRIQDMDNINQQAKTNLIKQKQKQINELKEQQIIDIDRKIAKLKLLVRSEEHKLVASMIDKASVEQAISELNNKLTKLMEQEQVRKKQVNDLKQKNTKLEADLKQKIARLNFTEENPQKKSISLFPDGDTSKIQDVRKSYLDEFKKSRDFYMNKPFEQLKKINSELQIEKRRIQTEMNTLRFNFDKEKVQLNDKIRTKQRQLKKLEHQIASNEKIITKLNSDIQTLKKNKQDYDSSTKKLRQQLKQVSRTLQLKQRQCSQALSQIKRMQKNLQMYEQAEKKMFEDVKKMKQKLQKKQTEMEGILDERTQKSKQIDSQRLIQISKLEQRVKQLEQKLEREITQSLNVKNENEKLAQLNTEYDIKLKEKQQQNQAIKQEFDSFKTEQIQKSNELQNQNNLLQHNIMQIAQQIANKQQQCYEYQIKIQYSEKRQQTLKTVRDQLQQEIKQLKNENQSLANKLKLQYDQIMEQEKSMKAVKYKVDAYAEDLAKSQLKIQEQERINQLHKQQIHEYEKQAIRLELEKKNLEMKIQFLNENYKEKVQQVKKLEIFASEKQMQIQKIINQKSGKSVNEEKSRKSSEGFDLSPGSPSVRNKLNTSIHKSNSLIHQPKSSKNINSSSLIRKSSSKEKDADDSDHIKYSKQGIQINFLRPVKECPDDLKGTLAMPKKQSFHESSKVDIDVNQSDEQNPKRAQSANLAASKNQQSALDSKATPQKPATLQRQFDSEQEIENEQSQHELNQRDYEGEIAELQQKIQNMRIQMEQITEQRDGYLSQLLAWKNTYERESNTGSQILIKQNAVDRIKQNQNNSSLQKSQQSDMLKKPQLKKSPSYRSHMDINQQFDRSNVKKVESYQKQIQQLRSKLIEYQMAVTENENHIRQLEQGLANEQAGGEKLINEIQDTMQKLQNQVNVNKRLQEQMSNLQHHLCQKIVQLQKQMEQMIIQEMKKDETIKQTMKIVEQLNEELRQKDAISQTLQNQISKLKAAGDKTNKILNANKSEYRKYQQEAQLQILRLKETTDDLNASLTEKSQEVIELTQRFVELEERLHATQQQIEKKQHMILVERSKIKDAFDRRDQVMDEMKKFDGIKATLIDKVGDLEIRIGQKNQQLKRLTKQTAIAYKKYEIQLQAEREEHGITRKKLKQRQQHITNLKMQLANYNDTCHDLQKQKNGLVTQLKKVEKQLRQIMMTYQAELDSLNKDKLSFAKQVEKHQQIDKQNQLRIDVLNKQIGKKNREIKELTFKIEDQQNNLQKLKQRHRKEVGDLIADSQIKNDEFHKIKIQLERETEHYFSKEVEYLADREKKQKLESQYNVKLQSYEKIIKQMEQQLKDIQNRPSSDQWEQVCFQNELYKNRVEQLQSMLRDNGQQQQQRIIAEFKRYKLGKEREVQDMESEMQKYRSKFHSLQETNYVLKKDNDSMKVQLRTVMQEKMRIQKTLKEYEEDLKEIREQLSFYKAKRVDDLNKLLNETYD